MQQGLGFFLPLDKMLALGRKETNSSLFTTTALLPKQKPRKHFGQEKLNVS